MPSTGVSQWALHGPFRLRGVTGRALLFVPEMAVTTKRRHVEETESVRSHRRAAGEVWTRTARAWHWLSDRDYSLSKGQAMALFAASSLAKNVRKACREIPQIRGLAAYLSVGEWEKGWTINAPFRPVFDRMAFEQNPFVNDVMRGAGSQQRQQPIRRFYSHVQDFFDEHLPRWKQNGKDPESRPRLPHKPKYFARTDWTAGRIQKTGDTLTLRTGRGLDEITVDWPYPEPMAAQLVYDDAAGETMVCGTFDTEKQGLPDGFVREREPKGGKVAGVDLGEKCLAAVDDGEAPFILDGNWLRQMRAVQNQEKEEFSRRIDRKQKGSNRWWKLVNAKKTRLKEIRDRIGDYLHKMSTRLVEECWSRGVETIVFGDLTGIRDDLDYGADMNRRLHQWAFRQFIEKVTYKADRYGMTVCEIGEAHTSSTCPSCGAKVSPNDRVFRCSDCGFEAHRDHVGAVNIRALFLQKEEDEDLERPSRDRVFEAVRATATEEGCSIGSPSGGKSRLPLFAQGTGWAPMSTRVTPTRTEYHPHMDCVFDPDRVAEG